jgi:hypothetical protein
VRSAPRVRVMKRCLQALAWSLTGVIVPSLVACGGHVGATGRGPAEGDGVADASPSGGGGPVVEASVRGPVNETGDPPPYCVAPCVWEVVKHCLPELRACATLGGLPAVICDPATGWAEYSITTRAQTVYGVLHDGGECLRWISGNFDSFPWDLSVGAGPVVAVRASDGTVYCATYLDLVDPSNHVTDAGIQFGNDTFSPAQHLQRSRPECAAWDEHGLPVHPPCDMSQAGTCEGLGPKL